MVLFLSMCMPSLSFYLTLHRPVTEWAQVATPWSASIKERPVKAAPLPEQKERDEQEQSNIGKNVVLSQCSCCLLGRVISDCLTLHFILCLHCLNIH